MVRSLGFGSNPAYLGLLIRPNSGSLSLRIRQMTYACTKINSLDRSTKSTPSQNKSAPTPCRHTISGSISLPSRGSFHLSLAVLVHYRSRNIFSLGRWTSQIQTGFLVPRPTQENTYKVSLVFVYAAFTLSG
jgi:hypothetical protein